MKSLIIKLTYNELLFLGFVKAACNAHPSEFLLLIIKQTKQVGL